MKLHMIAKGDSEQVVGLTIDITSDNTMLPLDKFVYDGIEYLFSSRGNKRRRQAAYCMMVIEAKLEWRDPFNKDNFADQYLKLSTLPKTESFKRLQQMLTYQKDIQRGDNFPRPILMKQGSSLIQADGARRIIANKLAGQDNIYVTLVLRRSQIADILEPEFVKAIQVAHKERKWFDDYQDIVELCIPGRRKAKMRFPGILDFSCCKNKTLVDFGCNTGHTLFEAYYNGASRCIGFEYTQGNVDIINKLAQRLNIPVEAHCMDFNDPDFEAKALKVIPRWDYSLFLSVYRTKELKDRNRLLQFIWDNARRGMFFEGHSEPSIDTKQYYDNVLKQLDCKDITILGQATDLGVGPRLNYFLKKD